MNKILVVDDDEIIRANLVEMLETEGFDVLSAENGRSGVLLARQHLPSVIICDILMPEIDGYGVLTELRQEQATATIPFIFLTALADRSDLRQGMNLGADDYLVKPFTRIELLKVISTRLAKQEIVAHRAQIKLDSLRGSIALALPHELRTPLSGIVGYSELLAQQLDSLQPHEIQEIARGLNDSAKRLHDLVLNFLLYAELEIAARDPQYARAMLEGGPCHAQVTVKQEAIQQAQKAGREADLHLDIEDTIIPMGAAFLAKIVKELVQNAIKFSKAGTPVRVVGCSQGQAYLLSIHDRGRGMTPEQIADVGAYLQFERQWHEQQGSGLGLIIARRLAELSGGALTIESVYGQETTVRVLLPI